jgi:capsular polysaccharide biosynthesis protein
MELTYYLRVVGRHWLVAVVGLALTIALTAAFVQRQPFVYQSTGTMVVRPRPVNTDDGVRAIDALTRGVEISSTYATIARSDLIRDRAKANISPELNTSGTSVSSEVVTSTSILEVSVTGGDPDVVHALADEITTQTVAYVGDLQTVFELQIIDEPQLPNDPIAPNRPLMLATGAGLGVIVGVLFALIAEAVSGPARARRRYARTRFGRGDRRSTLIEDDHGAPPSATESFDRDAAQFFARRGGRRRSRQSSA